LEPQTNSPNVIGGYQGNLVPAGVTGATISGGGGIYFDEDRAGVIRENVVGEDFGAIGGGLGNYELAYGGSISGGQDNRIEFGNWYSFVGAGVGNIVQSNAAMSVIGGGEYNTIEPYSPNSFIGGGLVNVIEGSAALSVIAGGALNRIQNGALTATIGGGGHNEIQAYSATIPGGQYAKASSYGQFAYAAGGYFDSVSGQAQTSTFVLNQQTTGSTPTELLLGLQANAPLSGERISVPANAKWSFDILVVASNSGGETAGFQIKGVIKNVGATTKFVGTPTVVSTGADPAAAAWSVSVEADATHQALVVKASGDATLIRWVASVRTVEVVF